VPISIKPTSVKPSFWVLKAVLYPLWKVIICVNLCKYLKCMEKFVPPNISWSPCPDKIPLHITHPHTFVKVEISEILHWANEEEQPAQHGSSNPLSTSFILFLSDMYFSVPLRFGFSLCCVNSYLSTDGSLWTTDRGALKSYRSWHTQDWGHVCVCLLETY
jgi:hypothetical protein